MCNVNCMHIVHVWIHIVHVLYRGSRCFVVFRRNSLVFFVHISGNLLRRLDYAGVLLAWRTLRSTKMHFTGEWRKYIRNGRYEFEIHIFSYWLIFIHDDNVLTFVDHCTACHFSVLSSTLLILIYSTQQLSWLWLWRWSKFNTNFKTNTKTSKSNLLI